MHSSKVMIENLDKEKYELVGRKLICLGHLFSSPRIAITVGLKIDAGHKGTLTDM